MNPAILGALIGAIPGTIAAALASWTSIQASRASLQQARWTLDDHYSQWIREKRADVYLELLTFLRNAYLERFRAVYVESGKESIDQAYMVAWERRTSGSVELIAKAQAFATEEAQQKFEEATKADTAMWVLLREKMKAGTYSFGDAECREAAHAADDIADSFRKIAAIDLQRLGGTDPYLRPPTETHPCGPSVAWVGLSFSPA